MKNPLQISLRLRLLALMFLALLPAFALIGYNAVEDNRRAEREAQQTALRLVRLAAQNHKQMIDEAYDLLTLLGRFSLVLLDRPACQSLLEDLARRHQNYVNFLVLDPKGTATCSGRRGYAGVNYADRQWFKDVVERRQFVVSEYVVGRVTSKPSVIFAAPVLDRSGAVQGVVSVSALLEWLDRTSEYAHLPPGSTLTLLDSNGTVLARRPETEKWVGRLHDRRHALTQNQEGTTESLGLDGIDRLYAFQPLGTRQQVGSWHLAVGIPRKAAYGETRALLARNLLLMAVVALLVLAAAWWGSESLVLRPIRALLDTSARLTKGDLSARTGMSLRRDEIGQLAGALDQMTEAMEMRESDRRSADQTRAQLAAIVESSSDAIISRKLDGDVTSWNKGAENLFGYTADEMIGRSILLLVPDNQIDQVTENFENIKRGRQVDSYEAVRLKKGGTPVDVSVMISPIIDSSGTVIGASSITRDIGKRKRAGHEFKALHDINLAITSTLDRQAILQILLERIESLLPHTASQIWLLDPATGRLEPVACRDLDEARWKSGETVSHVILRTILRSKRSLVIGNLQTDERILRRGFYREQGLVSYLGTPLIVKDEAIGVLSLLTRQEHEFTPEEIRFAETLAKQASIAIYNSQLYEGSKSLLEELAVREEQIKALANGLMNAQDEEARRIAHVLHDESGQLLAMVYISLDELARDLNDADRARVDTIKGLLDEVENRLRDLSHELHPAMLDHLGLLPSLEHLVEQIAKRAGIQIAFDGSLNSRLSPLLELTIYRIVQEALNNVIRHADASRVQVRVLQDEDLVQCAVQDNGAGFDPGGAVGPRRKNPTGLGLAGMRERVEAVGGTFQVLSARGEGTKLFVSVPLEKTNGSSSIAC